MNRFLPLEQIKQLNKPFSPAFETYLSLFVYRYLTDYLIYDNNFMLSLSINSTLKRLISLCILSTCFILAYANLTPSSTDIDFGIHVQGTSSAPHTLTLTNNSGGSLTITDVSLSGIHPNDFTENFAGSITLGDGNAADIEITFMPDIWGHRVAQLIITHTGPNSPLVISLSGDATEDCNSWNEVSNGLDKRLESVMEVVDERMYVFASYIDDGSPNLVINGLSERYNPFTDVWTRIATMPNPVSHAGSTVEGDDIWIVGGFENWPRINTTDVQIYNTKTDTWSMGPSLPEPRNTAAVELIGDKIYVFGGFRFDPNDYSDEEDIPETLVLDLDDLGSGWQTLANMPQPRNHMGSSVMAGKIYALGGQQNHNVGGTDTDYVHEYDPVTDIWTQKAAIPFAFSHNEPATFTYSGQIIMAGGRTFSHAGLDRVMSYDPFSDTWTQICDLPIAVAGAEAAVMDNKLFLAHGVSATSGNLLDSTFSKSFGSTSGAQMQFYPTNIAAGLTQGDQESGEVVLYTLGGEATYTIDASTIPFWMTVDKNFSGKAKHSGTDIEYTIYTNSLPSGTYSADLVATAPGFPDAEVHVDLEVNTNTFPVELIGLEASLYQSEARLRWQTATEINSSHFLIERRHENEDLFTSVGRIEAAGNSNAVLTYNYQEDIGSLPKGRVYYRLKMIDLDGSFSFSQIVALQFKSTQVQLDIFPNPNSGRFQLDLFVPDRQAAELEILDARGARITYRRVELVKGMNNLNIRENDLIPGVYLLRLQVRDGSNYSEKIVVN